MPIIYVLSLVSLTEGWLSSSVKQLLLSAAYW